jgi:Holliday junction DNA helicase RuvA
LKDLTVLKSKKLAMIYQLKGIVEEITQNLVVVDVNGVGYGVFVPERIIAKHIIPDQTVKLYIQTKVSQEDIQLFGFSSSIDREFFRMLLDIPRVGPKGALKILSAAPAVTLMQAILSGDQKKLASYPGIGGKAAQRLVIELQGKVKTLLDKAGEVSQDPFEEAIDVLIGLGCSPFEARGVIEKIRKDKGTEQLTFDDLLNRTLEIMAEDEMMK